MNKNKREEEETSDSNLPPGKVQKNKSTDKQKIQPQNTMKSYFLKATRMVFLFDSM